MTSVVGSLPVMNVGADVPVWTKFEWNSKVQHDIFRDWGMYYAKRRRENFAQYYLTQALLLNESDYMTLYKRSLAKARQADIDGSLEDAISAAAMAVEKEAPNCPINAQICDALYQLNQFENCVVQLKNNQRKFIGVKAKQFAARCNIVDDVIKDVTGKSLSLFYLKNKKIVQEVSAILKANEMIDPRPRWKILKEQGKCDILSIPDEEVEILSPLEIARRERAFNVIHQNYLNCSWHDVVFMKKVQKNANLLLEQCKGSEYFLKNLTEKQYEVVRKFINMIYCRNPLYYVSFLKFSNKKMLEKNKEAYLFRIQYQTHRNMIADLKHIRKLRKEKKVKQLSQYVEKVMGDYYVKKTNRVMCWKFEFINEVYSILALALTEVFYLPKTFKPHWTLFKLLHIKQDKIKENTPFVFGDRSTYQDGDLQDPVAIRDRLLIMRLERRLRFAKYSIEKCYLYHQMASVHLGQLHYDECCFNARRGIKESRVCNSVIWYFLCVIQNIKANTMQYKLEATKESVEEAIPIVNDLKSKPLSAFIEACVNCTEDDCRRKTETLASQRSSKASFPTSAQL